MKFSRAIALVSLAALGACSGNTVKNTLGLDHAPPDEFRVVSRPPLSVPPQFNLAPPSATAQAPGQLTASAQAESIVTGEKLPAAAGATDTATVPVAASALPSASSTASESAFLKDIGADKADPNVREKLTEERIAKQEKQEDDSSWWDFFSSDSKPKETIVNAKEESQRIKTDQDSGKPVTEGETPVVKQKDTGLLGKIFGY